MSVFIYFFLYIPGGISFISLLQGGDLPIVSGYNLAAILRAAVASKGIVKIRVGHRVIVGNFFFGPYIAHSDHHNMAFYAGIGVTAVVKEIVVLQAAFLAGHHIKTVGYLSGIIVYFLKACLLKPAEFAFGNDKPAPYRNNLIFLYGFHGKNTAPV